MSVDLHQGARTCIPHSSLRVTEPGHYTGNELAHTQGLSSVGIERVLQKERELLPHLRHVKSVTVKLNPDAHHKRTKAPTVYLAIFVRKMWDELFKKLLGGDSGVHQLAQGNVGLLPHALPRVSQPEM